MHGMEIVEETPYRLCIPRHGSMRVNGVVFTSRALLPDPATDGSLEQVANVATLPGIVEASYAMPDVHWGYGFPIGGVAATDVAQGGVVSPGGVGFDISCGVRLLAADLDRAELPIEPVMDGLDRAVPRGAGRGAVWTLSGRDELKRVLLGGSRYAVERGHGSERDLERCEDRGAVDDADPGQVSIRAVERGLEQVGSLGSGNHFLEVQAVDEVLDEPAAAAFGLRAGQVCVMIHTGSRGLGHQICTDHVRAMQRAMPEYGIQVPDRQLACAPVDSPEGRAYLGAMAAAANYGRANRQLLAEAAAQVFARAAGSRLSLVYDISHNLAKIEAYEVAGAERRLCVHRKGATRAFGPGHDELPTRYRAIGQPVIVPGSMGSASFVLTGTAEAAQLSFASTCHGAGRAMSRTKAKKMMSGADLKRQLEREGILVAKSQLKLLSEEAPYAYKDAAKVVDTCEGAGLSKVVARLRPVGVVKG
jgi:tRNA-splicing ligase RtcB (3'-phosphate/5'-hydroxy nucleic acid ligase)